MNREKAALESSHSITTRKLFAGIADEFLTSYGVSRDGLTPPLIEAFESYLLSAYYSPVRLQDTATHDGEISYAYLAEYYGVSKTAISAWMHGHQYPGLESFSRLAAAQNARFQPGFDVAAAAYAQSLVLVVDKLNLQLDSSEANSDLVLLLYHTLRSKDFYLWHATRSYRFLKQAFSYARDIITGPEHNKKWRWKQADAKQRINRWLEPWCIVEGCVPYGWF